MAFTLDDVLNAPSDPELLQRHLQNLGALPMPVAPTPTVVSPMRPPNMEAPAMGESSFLKPMAKPSTNITEFAGASSGPTHLPAMKTAELPEAPAMPMTPQASFGAGVGEPVKPMTPPTAGAAVGSTAPAAPGSVPFYEQELTQALSHRPDALSDHPTFGGKVGHVLGRIGNIAGDILAPATMAMIPGTDIYNRMQVNRAERNLAGAQREASEEGLRKAQTDEAEARAAQLGEPSIVQDAAGNAVGWKDPKGGIHVATDPETPPALKEILSKWQGKQVEGRGTVPTMVYDDLMHGGPDGGPRINPKTNAPYTSVEAGEQAAGMAPQKATEGELPLGPRVPQLNGALQARYQVLHPGQSLPADFVLAPDATQKDFDRIDKVMQQEENAEATKEQHKQTDEMRRQTQALAQGNKADARSDKSYQYNKTELEKHAKPVEDAMARMGRLDEALNQGNPLSDALIAPELLSIMAGGAGSGLRMNEAEISRIVGGRGHWDDLRGAVQRWNLDPKAARSITPEQDREIRALVGAVRNKLTQKNAAVDDARQALLGSDDPKEHRRIVTDLERKLNQIDSGGAGGGGGAVKIGGKEYEVNQNGRINVNGTWYQTKPGSKQVKRVDGPG